jgi:hypothetical protein
MHPLCQNVCIVAMLIASFSLTGCWSKTRSSGSTGYSVTKDGKMIVNRNVKYSGDGGNMSLSATGNSAHVTFSGSKITVEADRILLDDKEVAKIPQETKEVDVDFTNGLLIIKADGAKVHEAKMGK